MNSSPNELPGSIKILRLGICSDPEVARRKVRLIRSLRDIGSYECNIVPKMSRSMRRSCASCNGTTTARRMQDVNDIVRGLGSTMGKREHPREHLCGFSGVLQAIITAAVIGSYHRWTRNRDRRTAARRAGASWANPNPPRCSFQSDVKFLIDLPRALFQCAVEDGLTVATHAPFGDYSTGPSAPRST
jgi:hypothetical protein